MFRLTTKCLLQLKLARNFYLCLVTWLGTFPQRGILILLPLHLTGDWLSVLPLPRILLVWSPHLYFLPGYWLISVSLNQYKWQLFTVYKSAILQQERRGENSEQCDCNHWQLCFALPRVDYTCATGDLLLGWQAMLLCRLMLYKIKITSTMADPGVFRCCGCNLS